MIVATIGGMISNSNAPPDPTEVTDPVKLDALRGIIAGRGYACDKAKLAWDRGESPYGERFDVDCGPAETTGVYKNQAYAVYPEKLRVEICPGGAISSC